MCDGLCVMVYVRDRQLALFDEPDQVLPVPDCANNLPPPLTFTVATVFSWLLA